MNNLVQTIERITPTMAKKYLETSNGNRPISMPTVKTYAKAMKEGRWRMNGVSGYNKVSGVVSANAALENTGRIRQNNGAKGLSLANDVYYAKWSEYPEDYADCTKFAENLYRIARIMRISWIGGLTFYLTHTGGYRVDFVKKFFSAACNLETSGITPADELRKFILRNERNNEAKKITDEYLFAIVVKAWNAYARNKTVGMLRYLPNSEEYPTLLLNTARR